MIGGRIARRLDNRGEQLPKHADKFDPAQQALNRTPANTKLLRHLPFSHMSPGHQCTKGSCTDSLQWHSQVHLDPPPPLPALAAPLQPSQTHTASTNTRGTEPSHCTSQQGHVYSNITHLIHGQVPWLCFEVHLAEPPPILHSRKPRPPSVQKENIPSMHALFPPTRKPLTLHPPGTCRGPMALR